MIYATPAIPQSLFLHIQRAYQRRAYRSYLSLLRDNRIIDFRTTMHLLQILQRYTRELELELNADVEGYYVDPLESPRLHSFAQGLLNVHQPTPRHLTFRPEPCQYS